MLFAAYLHGVLGCFSLPGLALKFQGFISNVLLRISPHYLTKRMSWNRTLDPFPTQVPKEEVPMTPPCLPHLHKRHQCPHGGRGQNQILNSALFLTPLIQSRSFLLFFGDTVQLCLLLSLCLQPSTATTIAGLHLCQEPPQGPCSFSGLL